MHHFTPVTMKMYFMSRKHTFGFLEHAQWCQMQDTGKQIVKYQKSGGKVYKEHIRKEETHNYM